MAVVEVGIVLLTEVVNGVVLRFILDSVHLFVPKRSRWLQLHIPFCCSQNLVKDPIKPAVYQFPQQLVEERKI